MGGYTCPKMEEFQNIALREKASVGNSVYYLWKEKKKMYAKSYIYSEFFEQIQKNLEKVNVCREEMDN